MNFCRLALWPGVFAAACMPSLAQVAAPPRPPSPAPATSFAAPMPSLVSQAARAVGVVQCLPGVERLSSVALAGSRGHDVLIDWDRAKPDAGPFFSLVGVNFGTQSIAATITAIPQGNDGCTLLAERISVAPYTCQSIAEVELKGYKPTRLLPTFTVYTTPADPGASVSLIDSPPMCLVVRRHVQYGWVSPDAQPQKK